MEFIPRFCKTGKEHFFLLGPRKTGETLWSRHHFPEALLLDLLDLEIHRSLAARPERLIELVAANSQRSQVVIDEIQKLPVILEVVHLLIERKTGQQFVLTSSSARKLRRGLKKLCRGLPRKSSLFALSRQRTAFARGCALSAMRGISHGAETGSGVLRGALVG